MHLSLEPLNAVLLTAGIAVCTKTGAWLLQLRTRNAGVVVQSGPGPSASWHWSMPSSAAQACWIASRSASWAPPGGCGLACTCAAEPRQAGGLALRPMRAAWGGRADAGMFLVFQFRPVHAAALGLRVPAGRLPAGTGFGLGPLALAAAIWCASQLGEARADEQMEHFRADPANRDRVCRIGLWRWSRHPINFFECLHWLAYAPLAWSSPYGWVTLGGRWSWSGCCCAFSGVPLLEAEMLRRKPDYRRVPAHDPHTDPVAAEAVADNAGRKDRRDEAL